MQFQRKKIFPYQQRTVRLYLESDFELFGRLDEKLQALLHHVVSWEVRLPCGTTIKRFSALALALSRAGSEAQLTVLPSPTRTCERAEIGNLRGKCVLERALEKALQNFHPSSALGVQRELFMI